MCVSSFPKRLALLMLSLTLVVSLVTPAHAQPAESRTVIATINGLSTSLELTRTSQRAPDMALLTVDANGIATTQPNIPDYVTYRGVAQGQPNSAVAASIFTDDIGERICGYIDFDTTTSLADAFFFSGTVTPGRSGDELTVVPATEALVQNVCGATVPSSEELESPLAGPRGPAPFDITTTRLAIDTDVELYQRYFSSIPETVQQIECLLNITNLIFELDTGVSHDLAALAIRTQENDPYNANNINQRVIALGQIWNNEIPFASTDWELVHLVTQRPRDPGINIIGIANTANICNPTAFGGSIISGFSLPQTVGLIAHEIGHNWGAPHCNSDPSCAIMCSGLGGCTGNFGHFAPVSTAAIDSYITNSLACQPIPIPTPLTLPIFDDFENPSLDIQTHRWPQFQNASLRGVGGHPPSPFQALRFAGSNNTSTGFILTQIIDAADASLAPLELSYWTHKGNLSPGGETLTLQAQHADGSWHTLDSLTFGTAAEDFVPHSLLLTTDTHPELFHSQLRLRFLFNDPNFNADTSSTSATQIFVDDFSLAEFFCDCDLDRDKTVAFFDLLAFLDLWFAGDIGADFNNNFVVNFNDLLDFLDCWFTPCP